jgi:hypothetical protein
LVAPGKFSAGKAGVIGLLQQEGGLLEQFVGPIRYRLLIGGSGRPHLLVHCDKSAAAVLAIDPLAEQIHPHLQHPAANRAMLVEVNVSRHGC